MTIEWKRRARCHVLGHDVPHDGGVINFNFVTSRVIEPEKIIPALFAEVDPTLIERIKPGDYIVAGRNFLCGKAHNNGLIGLKALDLRILCESMPYRSLRASVGMALPSLINCVGISSLVKDGDEIEADFATGEVKNLTTGESAHYPGLARDVKMTLEQGGMKGLMAKWLEDHPELGVAAE